LKKFCEWFGKSSDEILEMRKKDVVSDDQLQKRRFAREIEKFHAFLLKQGYKINTARVLCLGIMQLFSFFEYLSKNLCQAVFRFDFLISDGIMNLLFFYCFLTPIR